MSGWQKATGCAKEAAVTAKGWPSLNETKKKERKQKSKHMGGYLCGN